MKFEEKLMILRKEKGWSQEELSNQIGVSRQTISKWESSQTTPELNKLVELSKVFGISIDELVDNVQDTEVEKVYTKVNFKPTYILMGIIALLISIILIVSIIHLNKKEEKTYVESNLMINYEMILNDKIEVLEIHSFDESDVCLGTSVKIVFHNIEDYQNNLLELSKEEGIENIIAEENVIIYFTNAYRDFYKNKIIENAKTTPENIQNLQITDM